MRRINLILLILISLFSFASCATTGEEVDDEFYERASLAVETLGLDMITNVDFMLDPVLLQSALEYSFIDYENILPNYPEIRDEYLNSVAEIMSGMLKEETSMLEEYVYSQAKEPIPYVAHDKTLTSDLKESVFSDMEAMLKEKMASSAAISSCFEPVERAFSPMRDAYLNLGKIGVDIEFPVPEPINQELAVAIALEEYFKALEAVENNLKNQGYNPESLYYIFWEGDNV